MIKWLKTQTRQDKLMVYMKMIYHCNARQKRLYLHKNIKSTFIKNYLHQFLTNKLPSVEEDAAVFDLEEGKTSKG